MGNISTHEQQQIIVAHEQSHLEAGDPRLLAVALGLLVLMPWNLPLWWQCRRLRYAIEVDCDTRVLKGGHSISSYGNALVAVGQRQSGHICSVAGMSESTSFLEKRIKIMVTTRAKWWRIAATSLGISALSLVAVATQVSPPNASEAASVLEKGTSLSTSELEVYVGTYKLFENGVMTISRQGSQLFSQLTGQPAAEFFPASRTEFFYKIVAA